MSTTFGPCEPLTRARAAFSTAIIVGSRHAAYVNAPHRTPPPYSVHAVVRQSKDHAAPSAIITLDSSTIEPLHFAVSGTHI